MAWTPFLLITALGAAIWCGVLVAFGWYLGEPALALVREYTHEAALATVAALLAFIAWFLFHKTRPEPRA